MATTTLNKTKLIKRKYERRIERGSVMSFVRRIQLALTFRNTNQVKKLETKKELRAVMSDPLRVNWR